MDSLFLQHTTTNIPIVLVDASGSVRSRFRLITVFDKIMQMILETKEEKFRLIFWNSDRPETPDKKFFTKGIFKLPFVVSKETLHQTFKHVQPNIHDNCLTFPHLAFDNIPNEWINDKDLTKIYFVTDGQIGFGNVTQSELQTFKNTLGDSIKKLFEKHNNIQLNIITVEPKNVDLSTTESTQSAAGCDVYDVIMNGHLTKYIAKFVSYTLNNSQGFIHINKNTPPAGFAPYGDSYFSVLKVNEFIRFIMNEIAKTTTDDEQLKIIQSLSSTLTVLTKDKQPLVFSALKLDIS